MQVKKITNKDRIAIDKLVEKATPKQYEFGHPGFCIDCGTDEMFSFYNPRCKNCHEDIWYIKMHEHFEED